MYSASDKSPLSASTVLSLTWWIRGRLRYFDNEPYEPSTSAAKITPPLKTNAATDEPVTTGDLWEWNWSYYSLKKRFLLNTHTVRVRIFRSATVSNGLILILLFEVFILKSSLSLIVSELGWHGLNPTSIFFN